MSENMTKLAIIGAGPGGIGAAIEAKIAGIDSILFEKTATHNATLNKFYKDGKRVDRDSKGDKIELNGAIDFSDSNKEATLEMFGNLLEKHQINVAYQNDIESVVADDKNGGGFVINTSGGKSYTAQCVIIATALAGKHSYALLDFMREELKPLGEVFYSTDEESEDWLIADLGDVMVHIFTHNHRAKFNLEEFLSTLPKRV